MTTVDTLVPERLWQAIQPLLPTPAPRYGGRPRADDRAALAGIVYQLHTVFLAAAACPPWWVERQLVSVVDDATCGVQ